MSGGIGALGDLATAGLAASALDAPAGGREGHGVCANCGAALAGRFCGNCGQAAHVHRSLLHVGEEFLHGITHFDGKAWKTLPMLLFRPGKLTRDYIMGHRARYVAPVPLFLLVVFLMFFVFSWTGTDAIGFGNAADTSAEVRAKAVKALPAMQATVASLEKEIAAANAPEGDRTSLLALEPALAAAEKTRDRMAARAAGKVPDSDEPDWIAAIKDGRMSSKANINLGSPRLDAKVRHALANPELALYKVQGAVYKFSFLLVPLSLPWLWLLFFWKRGVRMYDHSVFALYSIAFMSLLFTAVSLLAFAGVEAAWVYVMLAGVVPLAHIFVQLKGAYALTTGGALWRMAVLATMSIVILTMYIALMLVLGLLD